MLFALYVLYAFVQAVLIARYIIEDDTAPVLLVMGMTLFAPVATLGMIVHYGGEANKWLVTYKPRKK